MLPALAQQVAAGQARPERLEGHVWRARMRRLAPSARVEVVREGAQRGTVTRLDMDPLEERYLLAAAGDGTVGLYDLAEGDGNYGPARRPLPSASSSSSARTGNGGGAGGGDGLSASGPMPAPVRVRCLQATPRGGTGRGNGSGNGTGTGAAAAAADGMGSSVGSLFARGPPAASLPGHSHVVTTVQWYPLDTGLFVSGSADGTVRVWDTNTLVSAGVFEFGGKVHAAAMSPAMRAHSLVAVGTDDRRVRLCDLKSGGSSHLLMGHSEAVLTAAWSPTQEHLLATGSRDATVRLWDVRRSGANACLATLDQHADHHQRRAPGLMGGPTELAKAHDGWVVSLAFAPNGAWLLSAGTDRRLRLWNAATGENTLRNFMHTRNDRGLGWAVSAIQPGGAATAMALYPNGASGDVHLYALSAPSGDGDGSLGLGLGLGLGGRRRMGADDGGRPLHVLRGHLDAVSSAVYRRDAEQVVTGGADSLILVFDCSRHDALEGRRLRERDGEDATAATAAGPPRGRAGGAASAAGAGAGGGGAAGDAWSSDEEEEEEGTAAGEGGGAQRRRGFVPPIIQQLIAGGGTLPPAEAQPAAAAASDSNSESERPRGRGNRSGSGSGAGGRSRKRSRGADGRGGSGGGGRRGRLR